MGWCSSRTASDRHTVEGQSDNFLGWKLVIEYTWKSSPSPPSYSIWMVTFEPSPTPGMPAAPMSSRTQKTPSPLAAKNWWTRGSFTPVEDVLNSAKLVGSCSMEIKTPAGYRVGVAVLVHVGRRLSLMALTRPLRVLAIERYETVVEREYGPVADGVGVSV